ncbi:MAG: DUF2997 domain-containing protein [Anaerolineaceae bacterium]|jgi:hypothetical protein
MIVEIQEIEVTIDKNGQVKIHVRGVKGEACLDITCPLETALGGELTRVMTPEALEDPGNPIDTSLSLKS